MATEKRLIDAVKHRLEYHIAKAIYWGVDNIPTGKDSSSAFEFLRGYERGATETANIVLGMIPADAVEVVRCKDCKHLTITKQTKSRFCNVWCTFQNMSDENFCSYGERKDDD